MRWRHWHKKYAKVWKVAILALLKNYCAESEDIEDIKQYLLQEVEE